MSPGASANVATIPVASAVQHLRAHDAHDAHGVPWPELVGMVRRSVRRLAGPCRDVDDLTQSVLEQVVRGLERYEGRAEISTFVYRIAAHVTMNHWRWWRRWLKRFELGGDEHEPVSNVHEDPGPSASFEARERARRVHALLDRLDAPKRIVLVLSDMEELPASRIAEILECPEPTVRSRLRLARARLAELVREDPFFGEEASS